MKKKSVKTKTVEVIRVPSGIPHLDPLIEGGFEKKSTNLLVGTTGTGKSIFGMQFLMEGISEGEKCLYVTFEEKKEEVYSNMRRFKWNLEKHEQDGLFIFLEYSPEKVRTMLEEGGGAIENLIIQNKITRVVIDSITSFELLFDNELEKREAAFALFHMIRNWNCTALLTYETDVTVKAEDHRTLEFECDSIIVLHHIREGLKRKRFLEVVKMRGTEHSTDIYQFSITSKGIDLERKAYAGKAFGSA